MNTVATIDGFVGQRFGARRRQHLDWKQFRFQMIKTKELRFLHETSALFFFTGQNDVLAIAQVGEDVRVEFTVAIDEDGFVGFVRLNKPSAEETVEEGALLAEEGVHADVEGFAADVQFDLFESCCYVYHLGQAHPSAQRYFG